MQVLFINANDTSRHVSSANTAIYPNLGLLTLMSSLAERLGSLQDVKLGYLDGTVHGNQFLQSYVTKNARSISVICCSVLTANYGASLEIIRKAHALNASIVSIFGNDHFSALYERAMKNQPLIDFGFHGSDVVEGWTDFVYDLLSGVIKPLRVYPGLVYRKDEVLIEKNPEKPEEYSRLPLVNYSFVDSIVPHTEKYLLGQQKTYHFMRGRGLRSQVVDIGRGCIKFAGPRTMDIPDNACDFCGIIPGGKAISSKGPDRAWSILHNAFKQGYNYFYVTADELPLTLWSLLHQMAESRPEWYMDLAGDKRPKMFGYARAEGFETQPGKIDVLVDTLGFDHFFIGFDGLSEISLDVMNKRPMGKKAYDLMQQNMVALEKVVRKGCLVTAGLVVTHLGITPEIMEENYHKLEEIVTAYPTTFAALDFGPLCPIPGSQAFRYLTHPEYAVAKANMHKLSVDLQYLNSVKSKYSQKDCFGMDELTDDFVRGCCPKITPDLVAEHLDRIRVLAEKHSIVIGGGV